MDIGIYFSENEGTGVLSTADHSGNVGSAIYSKPRVMANDTLAFIMRERRTYENLKTNPSASYLFIDNIRPYRGIRIDLEKIREEDNQEMITSMTRRHLTPEEDEAKGPKHLVYFEVKKVLPLIGS